MFLKRLFDIFNSIFGIIVLFPLFMAIAILIKLNSRGPIFFFQNRIGKNGKEFRILKFRTMTTFSSKKNDGFEPGDISRITAVGRILRITKMDEFPQLINIIKGDMSFVGPRPEVKKWTEFYPEKWKVVLSVKPGITDKASIEFRNEEELLSKSEYPEEVYLNKILPIKLDLNIDYAKNHTFSGDLIIILRTLKALIIK